MDYSDIFEEVITRENVTKQTYLTCLQQEEGSKLFYLTAHSWEKEHYLSDSVITASDESVAKFLFANVVTFC
jgi:hypothetical protein